MTFSEHLLLAGAVMALAAPLCAQDCGGNIQTVPDFITVHIDDLGSFFLDPLLNDSIPDTTLAIRGNTLSVGIRTGTTKTSYGFIMRICTRIVRVACD